MAKSKVKSAVDKVKEAVGIEVEEEAAEVVEVSEEQLAAERDPFAQVKAAAVVKQSAKGEKAGVSKKKVKIELPAGCFININNVPYQPGVHTFEEHQVPSILEMIDKKLRADLSVSIGKKYMVDRLADRSLVVKEEKE